ncbi:MAG: murein biosynthesis integral membrane protein MurJ [Lautropia sp.]
MNLLKAAATVSGLTFLSRITGLVRETMTASVFGAGPMTDAFIVAFRLPNLLRRLFAEGAFSQAFVPILAATRAEAEQRSGADSEAARAEERRVIDAVATALFWILFVVSVLGVVGAPWLVWVIASGLSRDPDAFTMATVMTRWMFPYILMMSLVALGAGILNTWQRFAVPAASPVLLNLCFIGAALLLTPYFDPPVYALAAGVLMGGVAQVSAQVWALSRIGLLPRVGLRAFAAWREPAVRRVLQMMGPAVLAVSVAQLSLIINTQIASHLRSGSVSWISFGDRLMEFPTAMLGVALGTVLLPSLTRANTAGDADRYNALLDWGLRLAAVLAVPAMVGLGVLAEPITALVFHYGRFDATDVQMTARAVAAYSVGLFGLIAVKVLAPAFYARLDIRTPVKIGIAVLAITQVLNQVFLPFLAHAGLALAISVAAWINAGWLLAGLRRRGVYAPLAGWPAFIARVLVGALAMGAMLWWLRAQADWIALGERPFERVALAAGMIVAGAATYFAALFACGLNPLRLLRAPDAPSAPQRTPATSKGAPPP